MFLPPAEQLYNSNANSFIKGTAVINTHPSLETEAHFNATGMPLKRNQWDSFQASCILPVSEEHSRTRGGQSTKVAALGALGPSIVSLNTNPPPPPPPPPPPCTLNHARQVSLVEIGVQVCVSK